MRFFIHFYIPALPTPDVMNSTGCSAMLTSNSDIDVCHIQISGSLESTKEITNGRFSEVLRESSSFQQASFCPIMYKILRTEFFSKHVPGCNPKNDNFSLRIRYFLHVLTSSFLKITALFPHRFVAAEVSMFRI